MTLPPYEYAWFHHWPSQVPVTSTVGTAAGRGAFTEELANEIARLAAKYHDEKSPGGRRFQFFLGAYPAVTKEEP